MCGKLCYLLSPTPFIYLLHELYILCRGNELPAVPLGELYRRNVIRYLATGKFIPLKTLQSFSLRASAFLYPPNSSSGNANSNSNYNSAHAVSDYTLCSYAGYGLDKRHMVFERQQRGYSDRSKKGGSGVSTGTVPGSAPVSTPAFHTPKPALGHATQTNPTKSKSNPKPLVTVSVFSALEIADNNNGNDSDANKGDGEAMH